MANHYTFGIGQPHTEVEDDLPPVLFDEVYQSLKSVNEVLPLVICLGAQHTSVTAPADTSENVLYSLSIPGGTMGVNDTVRISYMVSTTNSANTKTVRATFGGSTVATVSLTTSASAKMQAQFSNRNSLASQVMAGATGGLSSGPNGTSSIDVTTLTIDTTENQTLTITGQKASAGETITLQSVLVELVRGPA